MIKIVLLDASTIGSDVSLDPISRIGELKIYENTTPEQVNDRISGYDVVVVNKVEIRKPNIDSSKSLKLICVTATGTNNIDVEYARLNNVEVKNVAGYSTESVSQVTFTHLFNLCTNGFHFDNYVKSGEYSRGGSFSDVSNPFREIKGKKLGIIAMGNIGKRVAEIASVMGMEVSYFSTSGTSHCSDYPSLSLSDLLKESDVVSIHAPLNEKTKGLIGYDELSLMKKTAFIINMGRGGIIVEEDLVKALNEGVIAGAGIDVFAVEPIEIDHPYLTQINDISKIVLSPHIAWASVEARVLLMDMVADNIKTFFSK